MALQCLFYAITQNAARSARSETVLEEIFYAGRKLNIFV